MTDQEILDAIDTKIKASEENILKEIKSSIAEIGDMIIKSITTG